MTAAIATVGLTKEYPGGAGLHGVDLEVPAGSVFGLIGPNGAGKTTLLSLIAGLRRPDAGRIELGVPRGQLAVCPDVPQFEPWMTGREVVRLAAALAGAGESAVDAALAGAGLGAAADRRVGGYSRGMTQRLALAATLVSDPAVAILDEPTSALDPVGRHEVLDLIAGMGRDRTVMLSSHILADVQRVCDTVAVLIDGRLRYQGPIDRLLAEHLQPAWIVQVRGDAATVADALARHPWVRATAHQHPDQLRVEVASFEDGETRLVGALAETGARIIAVEPAADDLEDAFLRLAGVEVRDGATGESA